MQNIIDIKTGKGDREVNFDEIKLDQATGYKKQSENLRGIIYNKTKTSE
jgi:hypothetical protein